MSENLEHKIKMRVGVIAKAIGSIAELSKGYEGDDLEKMIRDQFTGLTTTKKRTREEKPSEEKKNKKEKEPKEPKAEVCPGLNGKPCGNEGKHKKKVAQEDGKGKMVLLCDGCLATKIGEDKLAKKNKKKAKKEETKKEEPKDEEDGEEEEEDDE